MIVRAEDLHGPKAPLIKAYVQAVVAAEAKLNSDETFTAAAIKNSFPELKPDLAATLVHNAMVDFHYFPTDGAVSRESFANVNEALLRIKAIPKPIAYEDVVDTSLLPAAPAASH